MRDPDALLAEAHARACARWKPTPAQARVLRHLVRGLSNKEIAVALGVQEATVEVHVTRLFDRAGVVGRGRLAYAFWTLP